MRVIVLYGMLILGLALAAIVWEKWHLSTIIIESMGFRLETNVFNAVVILVAAIAAVLFLYKGTVGILSWPMRVFKGLFHRRKIDVLSQIEALMIESLNHNYPKARALLEELDGQAIPTRLKLILANNVAMLGDELPMIKQSFIDLSGCPETKNAGLEGLVTVAMQELDWETAHACCNQLWQSAPSEWLVATHIFLLIHGQAWPQLTQLLQNDRFKVYCMPSAARQLALVALYYQAIAICEKGGKEPVMVMLEAGLKQYGYGFMPLNLLLGELYLKANITDKLGKLLLEAWYYQPHPGLADLAMGLAAHMSKARFFTKIMNIAKTQEQEYESLLLVARAALSCNLYEEAQAALNSALAIQEGVRGCLMMAEYCQSTGANIAKTMEWLNRASHSKDDRPVLCYYWDTAIQQLTIEQTCTSLLIACV